MEQTDQGLRFHYAANRRIALPGGKIGTGVDRDSQAHSTHRPSGIWRLFAVDRHPVEQLTIGAARP